MFPPSKKYAALSRNPIAEDRASLYKELRDYGKFTGLCWLMSPEKPPVTLPVRTVEDIILSEQFLLQLGDDQLTYFVNNVKLSNEQILSVSNITIGQRSNPAWHLARKGRLTASNFGAVLAAKRVTPSLLKKLLGEYDLSGVKAIQWGVNNEAEAIKEFEKQTGLKVKETGIWLDESGILGASPDGLVEANAVLESKCPYTQRNMTIEEAINSPNFYLKKDEDGNIVLKKDHAYWHQAQGEMYLSKRDLCYFVVWTTKDTVVIKITKDNSWEENLSILKRFYLSHIFPKIIEGEL